MTRSDQISDTNVSKMILVLPGVLEVIFFRERARENRGEAAATGRIHTSRVHVDAEKYQTLWQ